jgi:glycosidase
VTAGTPVTLRLRTYHNDVTAVTVRLWSTAAEAQTLLPMQVVAITDDGPYGYDFWQATLPAQEEPTILWYRFIVRDGTDEDYYEDDDLFDGGWGAAYDESPDYSFQVDVFDPAFDTPEWMKNAVVYQLFPDRFYNGDPKIDAGAKDASVYGNPVLVKEWDDLPEGYCRGYEGVACGEGPLGRDFFGGDLQGVKDKLGYLADLGVTAIYFNPIFEAPSNHLYDTTDFFRIDPYFGSKGTLQSLINQVDKLGIRIILDGVFNHTSSDSVYFDRYSRYPKDGAFESEGSRYFDWYTFYEWPEDYNSWWGFDSLPVLAEVDGVRDLVYGAERSVARWWIEGGAAGWRLDVAPDKSHGFWQEFRPRVKEVDPEAIIIGEIWDDASPWILGDQLDTTMNYRFRRAMLGFLSGDSNDPNQGFIRGLNPEQFDNALQSIKEDYPPPAYASAMSLVGSHDTQRILWALTPGARNREEREFDTANLAEGKAKQKLLAIMQMTMPGAPTIYYGDEVGLTGDTDPDDRRPFPWDSMDTDMLAHYQTLTGLRNEYTFLRTGSFDRLYTHNLDGTYAYGRKDLTGAAVVAVNRDTAGHDLTVDLTGYVPEGTVLTDALTGDEYVVSGGQVAISLEGRGGAILLTLPGTDLIPPGAPTGLTASEGDGIVDLSWDPVAGAAAYHVYRSPVSGGGYDRLNDAPVMDLLFSDDTVGNGRFYYYVVTAVDEAGNESLRSNEVQALPHMIIGWANVQWPPHIDHTLSALVPTESIYGQVWIDGHTGLPGPTEGLLAEVGYGPDGSHPDGHPEWVWVTAGFNVDAGNNDEFMGQLLPEAVGGYDYAYRYSTTAGRTWIYADLDGIGNGYDPAQAGDLVVNPSGDNTPPVAPGNLRLLEASANFIHLAWDAVAEADLYRYEVYRSAEPGGPYSRLGRVLAPSAEYTDWDVAAGEGYAYVVAAVDTSFNESADSNELIATAQPRQVPVTFNVALPDSTPPDGDIYLAGSFNGWDPSGTLMARVGLFATVTLTFYEGDQLEYKYTRGSWSNVEKDASCHEIDNRALTVDFGSDGAMTVDDTVLNWRNTAPCGD